jgi:pimeloyl-ACP methyl ester carboxylesterase
MRLHVCIGLLESRDGPLLGLRQLVETQVLPQYPHATVGYYSWRDDLIGSIRRQAAAATSAGPLILLGHSYGASALVRAARRLEPLPIDHLIMLDPVPRWLWGQFQWTSYRLPPNVRAATCLYNPWSLPKSSPIRGRHPAYRNVTVSPLHASIPGDANVQSQVMAIIPRHMAAGAVRVPPVIPPAHWIA